MLGFSRLLKPAAVQARERMAAFEVELDAIAKESTARFCRGNAAIQLGLSDSEEDLEAQRQAMIRRRAPAAA